MADEQTPHDFDNFPSGLAGKRILLCTESLGPVNGVSRTTKMLVDQLRSNEVIVSVVAPYNHTKINTFNPISPSSNVNSLYQEEVRLAGYPLPFNPELSVAYPVRLSEIYRRTFGGPPDLIYLASPASLGFQVMLQMRQYAKELQVPVICNFQTDLARYCSVLFPWPLGGMANRTFGLVEGNLFRDSSVKTIFYPSTSVKKYLDKDANVPTNKMEVLRRGVNTKDFDPAKKSLALRKEWAPNGELILFTCSRIAGEKGFGFLAQVAKELDKEGLDFKLVIVGGNRNPVVFQEVKDMFGSLNEKGKVIFPGFKVGEDLMVHYASADIFLHCSITETFGLVVLEAMASGVPVIARDQGGPSDTIEQGKTGFLIPPDDLDGFVRKTMLLGRDSRLREQFALAGRAFACEATWERISNKAAWQMFDTIEQFKQDKQSGISTTQAPSVGWLPLSAPARRFLLPKIITAKIAFSLSIIFGFWTIVGTYLVFTDIGHLFKTHTPRASTLKRSVSHWIKG
ncbi:glycosyltransferase family 4 protein [Daldinia vernicosa]|uniref:glycosyltransferase family 4 protein n=1 Tax=Daldinia vernicosa TaxID=114800 RepID=UPI0020082CF8|nr:glycosyltransferase family 4 protein [Daldinia vernicosa]KAI0846714.1 glycosyltransferase family 4 protein [Daldinia vernicosa]